MASPPRRPVNPMAAAEALFKPVKRPVEAPVERKAPPNAKQLVTIKLDSAVIEHFQEEGPGWQDRLNDALVRAIAAKA